MRELSAGAVTEAVARLCIRANTHLTEDVTQAIAAAREAEDWPAAREILDRILENDAIGGGTPICQDTGMACVFLEVGQDVHITGDLRAAVDEGVRRGYADGYLRKSVVADPLDRVNTGDNTPAMLHVELVPGDRINAVLLKVDVNVAGPSLILSRTSPLFIRRLLEREVSEIHDGVVEIVAIARDPGVRTKIAVRSSDPRIDPVGACVGMRGMRVKNITNELGGERVDVINYSDRIAEYAANALHPAKAEKIEVDENAKVVSFYVTPENSRLAFGKKAQNVKLAQKLIGWKIDIKSETQAQEEGDEADDMSMNMVDVVSEDSFSVD